uniref:PGG domain-containing protein n=1 Tax=Setaria viridis TaxID=4556 RepID=A0A4U6W1E4_SETVI|nr:hypothetical protein SEVIR_2G349300v2 [Setaria viridis]
MEQTVAFGPHFMTLDQELLRVLTAGDAARLEELLRRQDQTHSHVAVNVQAAAAPPGAVAAPPWQGASCLLLGVTSNGSTALHLAASRGHAELAALRCERAPSLVATRNRGLDTPLHCAAKAGHRGALCARNCLSATALFEAVRHGHAAVVDLLMVLAPELASVATNCGVSPLYLAATTDSLQMVRALLRPSQDGTPSPVSFSGPAGRTALHAAAEANFQPGMAQEMLAWEPEGPSLLSRVDSSGRTPLHFAALYGRLDVVQLFLAVPTSVELAHIADSHGQFPLHAAAMKGNTRVLDELMKKCPDHHELVDDKAAFTVPGGFSSERTAILASRFAFRAFIVSNTTAFLFSTVATCFLMYGTKSSSSVPLNHRLQYNSLASGLVPVAAQFMIAAFAFGSHLVLGDANPRSLPSCTFGLRLRCSSASQESGSPCTMRLEERYGGEPGGEGF